MATREDAAPPQQVGDPTLVGTQLQLISERDENGATSKKLQLTSAIGLELSAARDFQRLLDLPTPDRVAAEKLLRDAGQNHPRFLGVLAATQFSSGEEQTWGRDGFPNHRLILDYQISAVATYQIHTILNITGYMGAIELAWALEGGNAKTIKESIARHCTIRDEKRFGRMLDAALA